MQQPPHMASAAELARRSPEVLLYVEPALRGQMHRFDGSRVLDWGCGTGNYCSFYNEFGAHEIVGLDENEGNIVLAKNENAQVNCTFQHADIFRGDLAAFGKFDLVLSLWTLHYLPVGISVAECARQLASCVAEGGRVFALTQFPTTAGRYQPFTYLRYPGLKDGERLPDVREHAPFELLDAMLQPVLSINASWPRRDEVLESFAAAGMELEEELPIEARPDPRLPHFLRMLVLSFRPPQHGERKPTRLMIFRRKGAA